MNALKTFQILAFGTALALSPFITGCKSAQEKQNEAAVQQAKQAAATTGVAQQVVYTDKDGSQVTMVVQPPAPGQSTQQITTTRTAVSTTGSAAPVNPAVGPAGSSAQQPAYASAPAAAPGGPTVTPIAPADIEIPAGTSLAIRINQHISVKHSRAGDRFTGEVAQDVVPQGMTQVAIPRGTHVNGVIDESHRRGHFKGRSVLELRLVSMDLGGQTYQLDTRDNVRTKKGKGKRSTAFIAGGSGLGMLVGGVATGGVGLVVGGLVGGGLGTGIAGLTGNRDIEIPAETVMNFRLADDLAVSPPQ
jgi:hypothetical protein